MATPEEQAVLDAAENMRKEYGPPHPSWHHAADRVLKAVDALRASRKRWRMDIEPGGTTICGPSESFIEVHGGGHILSTALAAKIMAWLNVAEESSHA